MNLPPSRFSFIDRGAWMLYDWLRLHGGATTPQFIRQFSQPLSHDRDESETNMYLPGRLCPPQTFSVYSIHTPFVHQENKALFRSRYALTFRILNKSMYQAPLISIPENGRRVESFRQFDRSAPRPGQFGDYPRVIPWDVIFSVELYGEPLTLLPPGLEMGTILNGVLDREVQ